MCMKTDAQETERLLNFVLSPKPAAIVAVAAVRRSMLPSPEALFPAPASTLAVCTQHMSKYNLCVRMCLSLLRAIALHLLYGLPLVQHDLGLVRLRPPAGVEDVVASPFKHL